MKTIQAAFRYLQPELNTGPQDWPSTTGMIQIVLNEVLLKRLGRRENGTLRSPLQAMTGLKPNRRTLQMEPLVPSKEPMKTSEKARALHLIYIDGLQKEFDKMHKDFRQK